MKAGDEVRHVISKDGSSTLFSPHFDEHYHSIHGAIQESMHVFIGAGLKQFEQNEVRILEMGFGTGLNALLTLIHGSEKKVEYTGLEAYPVPQELLDKLNYPHELGAEAVEKFQKIHDAEWEKAESISPNFLLSKHKIQLEEFANETHYDLVYFDAFAPSAQAELWTLDIFQKMYALMANGGILVTYCAKGDVRRAMIAAGFQVEKIPGPPGKREMLRAKKVL